MGILDKFFRKNENKLQINNIKAERQENKPALMLVFNTLPILEGNKIRSIISDIEKLNKNIEITLDEKLNNGETLLSVIEFDDHRIRLLGLNAPLPETVIEHTVDCSYWKSEDKQSIKNHSAHIICYYDGNNEDPVERYIALYKVAYSFKNTGLLGVINEDAWTCQPAYILDEMVSREMIEESRMIPPLMLWTNFIKIPLHNGTWMVTKGNHLFGIKDFAYKGDMDEAKEISQIFNNIFYYIYENNALIDVGHTLQIEEEVYLKFDKVYEEKGLLEGPIGTLVVKKIKPSEINKHC